MQQAISMHHAGIEAPQCSAHEMKEEEDQKDRMTEVGTLVGRKSYYNLPKISLCCRCVNDSEAHWRLGATGSWTR